jgi:uncharacterized membrane-anchored protein
MRVPFSPTSLLTLVVGGVLFFFFYSYVHTMFGSFLPHSPSPVVFLMLAILTGVKWNISVVLICISFMARDGEHFFHVFLAI